jgi:hypothetical protein
VNIVGNVTQDPQKEGRQPMDPLNRKKLPADEIEAELMKRIASRPDGANVASVHITSTSEQPPLFTWHLSAVIRHDAQVAAHALVEEVTRELQKEVDLLEE